tara:strand:+ start:10538 stop:11200 length:663 start_codon:yes stop_codon:yes gene_type:complete
MEQVDFAGALSWYSRAYLYGILYPATWRVEQDAWINRGGGWGFDFTPTLNELTGWDYWTQSQDFADIIYYIIICSILERKQRLTNDQHAYFLTQHAYAKTITNKTEMKEFLEELINMVRSMDVPRTFNALSYAYEKYLIKEGFSLIQSQSESSTRPTTGLSQQEKKEIQDQIEKDRINRKYGKVKGQKTKKLSTQNKIVYGSSLALLIIATSILISRRSK